MSQVSRGVIYCAISTLNYLEAALISAISLHKLQPNLPIVIISNFDGLDCLELEKFNISVKTVFIPESCRFLKAWESRLVKISLPYLTEFEETLYLDADILPLKPIHPIWEFLKHGNIAMSVDSLAPTLSQCFHATPEEKEYTLSICPEDSVNLNSGVILWKNTPKVLTLFDVWRKEWKSFKKHDQLALIRAIQETKALVVQLPNTYNFPVHWIKPDVIKQSDVTLYHCFGGRVKRNEFNPIAEELVPDSAKKALEIFNKGKSIELNKKKSGRATEISY